MDLRSLIRESIGAKGQRNRTSEKPQLIGADNAFCDRKISKVDGLDPMAFILQGIVKKLATVKNTVSFTAPECNVRSGVVLAGQVFQYILLRFHILR